MPTQWFSLWSRSLDMARIAVYITGHFRNFNETWPHYEALLLQHPCDIYIALWDVRNWADPTPVTEADIRAVCPDAKHIQVLSSDQPLDFYHHTRAFASQLYGLHAIFNVIPSTYDWYVRLRTDLHFFDTDLLGPLAPTADLWLPEKVWHTEANYPARDVFNDYAWIGSYEISAYIASIYTAMRNLPTTYMEQLFAWHLRAYPHPLRIGVIPGTVALDRRTRGHDLYLPESHDLTRRRRERELHAIYINLDRRTDRRAEIEAECSRMGLPVERFPACVSPLGPGQGCTLSHLSVLKLARERGYPSVLIFEDDFQFLIPRVQWLDLVTHLPKDYDVVMLSYNLFKSEPYNERFGRALDVHTASGYIVHSRFYDTLIATMEEGYRLYCETGAHWLYMNDQFWKRLQPTCRWYYSLLRVGKQRAGYSDLGQKFIDNGI
jgi:glycosyl transferase, family 25